MTDYPGEKIAESLEHVANGLEHIAKAIELNTKDDKKIEFEKDDYLPFNRKLKIFTKVAEKVASCDDCVGFSCDVCPLKLDIEDGLQCAAVRIRERLQDLRKDGKTQ